ADRLRALGRVAGARRHRAGAGVPGAVRWHADQARLNDGLAVGGGEGGAADDVVDRPRGDLEAVDRIARVVGVVQVQRPRHLPALSRVDRLQALPPGLYRREVGVVAAGHQREHPEDLPGGLAAGEVDLVRLGANVRVSAGGRDLPVDRSYAGRPG